MLPVVSMAWAVAFAALLTPTCADDLLVWETPGAEVDLAYFDLREQGDILAQVPATPTALYEVFIGCRSVPTTFCVTPVDRAGLAGPETCVAWEANLTWDLLEDTRSCSPTVAVCCEGALGEPVSVCLTRIVTDAENPESPCCAPPIGGRAVWP